jgi:hypothetical protein
MRRTFGTNVPRSCVSAQVGHRPAGQHHTVRASPPALRKLAYINFKFESATAEDRPNAVFAIYNCVTVPPKKHLTREFYL